MSGVTHIPGQIESGNGQTAEKLLLPVYGEIGMLATAKMPQVNPGQTPQVTALVQVLPSYQFSRVGAPP